MKALPAVGCLLALVSCAGPPFLEQLAGIPIGGAPHFHTLEAFVEGQSLRVAVDPARYPSKVGQTYRVYVVAHKTASQWRIDPSLVDLSGGFETATLSAGPLSANTTLAWGGMSLPALAHVWHKQYDVVLDFGNDGVYHGDTDIIDRIGVLEGFGLEETGGFTLLTDPAVAGDFPVGTHEYNEGAFAVSVPAAYAETGDPTPVTLIGKLYYPATAAGADTPVSTALPSYPVIVIAHGRHGFAPDSYLGYEYLARHLASRGFICASVALHELASGWRIHHRGVTILKHITRLISEPTTDPLILSARARMDAGRVALLGHSRGGEGVVAAQNIYAGLSPGPGYTLRAVAAFSPTDGPNWSDTTPGPGPYDPALPYLMIYGTRDGDLDGYAGNTGFRVVDRAGRPRHMITIHGGNHNFFNSTWGPDGSPTITRSQQETLAKAFLTPFFSHYLLRQQGYVEMLAGYVVPPSVGSVGTTIVYTDQPLRLVRLTVDDSQTAPPGASTNTLGQPNTNAGLSGLAEESLRYATVPARNYYTHGTDGLRMAWNTNAGSLRFGMGDRSVRSYEYLGFRVGQRFRASGNLNPLNTSQTFSITISDALGHTSPPVVISLFAPLPYTDNVGTYTKSVMQAIRVPLRAFTANGSPLDLRRVSQIRFALDQNASGELIVDDLELLGLDLTEPE
jgi:dienelactone hydrolase